MAPRSPAPPRGRRGSGGGRRSAGRGGLLGEVSARPSGSARSRGSGAALGAALTAEAAAAGGEDRVDGAEQRQPTSTSKTAAAPLSQTVGDARASSRLAGARQRLEDLEPLRAVERW